MKKLKAKTRKLNSLWLLDFAKHPLFGRLALFSAIALSVLAALAILLSASINAARTLSFSSLSKNLPLDSDKRVSLFIARQRSLHSRSLPHNPEWQPAKALLASTPERRLKAAAKLGIAKGEYTLALLSINCEVCETEALKLNRIDD